MGKLVLGLVGIIILSIIITSAIAGGSMVVSKMNDAGQAGTIHMVAPVAAADGSTAKLDSDYSKINSENALANKRNKSGDAEIILASGQVESMRSDTWRANLLCFLVLGLLVVGAGVSAKG